MSINSVNSNNAILNTIILPNNNNTIAQVTSNHKNNAGNYNNQKKIKGLLEDLLKDGGAKPPADALDKVA